MPTRLLVSANFCMTGGRGAYFWKTILKLSTVAVEYTFLRDHHRFWREIKRHGVYRIWNDIYLRLILKAQGDSWRVKEILDFFGLPNQHVGYVNGAIDFGLLWLTKSVRFREKSWISRDWLWQGPTGSYMSNWSLLNWVLYVLPCQRASLAYKLTCQRALHAYAITCQRALCAHLPTCLARLRTHVPYVPMCSRANVSRVLKCSRAKVPCVLTCQLAFHSYVLMR